MMHTDMVECPRMIDPDMHQLVMDEEIRTKTHFGSCQVCTLNPITSFQLPNEGISLLVH